MSAISCTVARVITMPVTFFAARFARKLAAALARSRALLRSALHILRDHPKLLVFPVLMFAGWLLLAVFALAPEYIYPSKHGYGTAGHFLVFLKRLGMQSDQNSAVLWLLKAASHDPLRWAAVYLAGWLVWVAGGIALTHAGMRAIAGDRVSIRASCGFVLRCLPTVLNWALIAATIGGWLLALVSISGRFGSAASRLAGLGWGLGVMLAIPVMVREGERSYWRALRRSVNIVRRHWGETLGGATGLGLSAAAIILFFGAGTLLWAGALAFAYAEAMTIGEYLLWAFLPSSAVMLLFGPMYYAAEFVFRSALYVYAAEGVVPARFDQSALETTWTVR